MTETTDLDRADAPGTVRRHPAFLALEWRVHGRDGGSTVLRSVSGFTSDGAWEEDADH
jgi:hypothetical protein